MAWKDGDRIYDSEKCWYGTITDVSDANKGFISVQYDNNDIGYINANILQYELYDPQTTGQALANTLSAGVTAEIKSNPWKPVRQLLKYVFDFWITETASKSIRENQGKINEILGYAEKALGYPDGTFIGIDGQGWGERETELAQPKEVNLQWNEQSIQDTANGLYSFIKSWLLSSSKTMMEGDWRVFVEEAYNDWMKNNAPDSLKQDPEGIRELQNLVTKNGIDINGVGTMDWFFRHEGKTVDTKPKGDWTRDVEKFVNYREPVKQETKQWNIGDEVWDPILNKAGYVLEKWEDNVRVRYYDGKTKTVPSNDLYAERPPSADEMSSMFKMNKKQLKKRLAHMVRKGHLAVKVQNNKLVLDVIKKNKKR